MEIKDKFKVFSEVLRVYLIFDLQNQNFKVKLSKLVLIFIFIYFIGLYVFSFKCKHLLLILLRLEFIVVSLYLGIFFCLANFIYEYYFRIIFLTLSVCEGSLGLSILVSIVRSYGNDYFQTFNILW